MISHMPWNRREEKLNSFNFFSSEYYITKINSCYSNNILDRKKILSCQNASNGIFWASRFNFFSGEECPQKSLGTHFWDKNDFEAIQKHPEFTSSKGWTVWENLLKDQNFFPLDHFFFYSHNLTFWLCMDIVRRK